MTANMKGEITASTILEQCQRISNSNIHAFFFYSPHLDEENKVQVIVKFNNTQIYNSYDNYGSPLADIMQDLIGLEYENV